MMFEVVTTAQVTLNFTESDFVDQKKVIIKTNSSLVFVVLKREEWICVRNEE
jgi:hypothetical protein